MKLSSFLTSTLSKMKVITVFLTCVTSIAFAGIPWVPEPRDGWNWMETNERFANNTRDNGARINVLFYGDSITEGWAGEGRDVFAQYYYLLGTSNYAIGIDRTEQVLWRIKNGEVNAERFSPKICVIKIGRNNIGINDATSIAQGVVFNVLELRERIPNTKILLLGVLPCINEEVTNITSAINDIIKHLDNGRTIRFLDMKKHFYNGGNSFNFELYTSDLVHLSAAGYQKWAEVMDPLFREMLV